MVTVAENGTERDAARDMKDGAAQEGPGSSGKVHKQGPKPGTVCKERGVEQEELVVAGWVSSWRSVQRGGSSAAGSATHAGVS